MSDTPLFSIVIPALNAAEYIEATLESVKAQTIHNFDVVVVDDGSSDDTIHRARSAIQRLGLCGEVIERPAHLHPGVAAARNHGVCNTSGTWIAFLDADDLFEPNKLERCQSAIDDLGGVPAAIHHAACYLDDTSGEVERVPRAAPRADEETLTTLLQHNYITTSTTVVHRACLVETKGFDTRLNGVEDYWLWIRIARRWTWRYIDEPLTKYRLRAGSLMHQRPFTHYVTQYTALLDVAEASDDLAPNQMAMLRRSVFDRTIRYFAGRSGERDGVASLLPGALRLAQRGYPGIATALIYRYLRARTLRWATRLVRL